MKKRLIQFALVLGLMALISVAAQATETASSGFRNIVVEEAYQDTLTLTPLSASNVELRANADGEYAGAVKMEAVYTGQQSGSEYLLFVMTGNERTPNANNLAYIDQITAGNEDLDFKIYPKKPADDATSVQYSVWMSSNTDTASDASGVTAFVPVASFEYYAAEKAPDVMLGDVNEDGEVTVSDAVDVLTAVVQGVENVLTESQQIAADVDKKNGVMVADAVYILQYVVWDGEKTFDELVNETT